MRHVGIEIKFYNLDTFKKQIGVNFIDLHSELVDLNDKVTSLIFCHVWRSIGFRIRVSRFSRRSRTTDRVVRTTDRVNVYNRQSSAYNRQSKLLQPTE